jgi:hypothetical protein
MSQMVVIANEECMGLSLAERVIHNLMVDTVMEDKLAWGILYRINRRLNERQKAIETYLLSE